MIPKVSDTQLRDVFAHKIKNLRNQKHSIKELALKLKEAPAAAKKAIKADVKLAKNNLKYIKNDLMDLERSSYHLPTKDPLKGKKPSDYRFSDAIVKIPGKTRKVIKHTKLFGPGSVIKRMIDGKF